MTMTQPTTNQSPSHNLPCPHCNAPLPTNATFCSSCGQRIDSRPDSESRPLSTTQPSNTEDFHKRYRFTSLVRRGPYVSLLFATDNQQSQRGEADRREGRQRTVAVRDIDMSSLNRKARLQAIELVQREYDLLRRWPIPSIMSILDFQTTQDHIYIVTGWKTAAGEESPQESLHTLHDLLQSGLGLPTEEQSLAWITCLCLAVDALHQHNIVIGDLDPYAIAFNQHTHEGTPALMVSWLLPQLRDLFLPLSPSSSTSHFSAPEALLGKAEPRSDVYSLGAILYLLLTGMSPDAQPGPELRLDAAYGSTHEDKDEQNEEPPLPARRRLRSPRELNGRLSSHLDTCILHALATDPAQRFQSAAAFAEALLSPTGIVQAEDEQEVETIRIPPLSQTHVKRWQASRPQKSTVIPRRPVLGNTTDENAGTPFIEPASTEEVAETDAPTPNVGTPFIVPSSLPEIVQEDTIRDVLQWESREERPAYIVDEGTSPSLFAASSTAPSPQQQMSVETSQNETSLTPATRLLRRITGLLPSLARPFQEYANKAGTEPVPTEENLSLLQQIQRTLLGEQRHSVLAAAVIETPLRVQPNQGYMIRIHVTGRGESPPQASGLSSLADGDVVSIEVRTALHQSYAYMVQRAVVTIPAQGYAAEVAIPMQPAQGGPSGRRDRLHIFFLDEMRRPLYEKPFVVEIFVSHLVKPGREGHAVLTIPL